MENPYIKWPELIEELRPPGYYILDSVIKISQTKAKAKFVSFVDNKDVKEVEVEWRE